MDARHLPAYYIDAYVNHFAEVFSSICFSGVMTVIAAEILSPAPSPLVVLAHLVDYALFRWTVVALWRQYKRRILIWVFPNYLYNDFPLFLVHRRGRVLPPRRTPFRVIWQVPALAACAWTLCSGIDSRMFTLSRVYFTQHDTTMALPESILVLSLYAVVTYVPSSRTPSSLATMAVVFLLAGSLAPLIPTITRDRMAAACDKTWALFVYLTARYERRRHRIAGDRAVLWSISLHRILMHGASSLSRLRHDSYETVQQVVRMANAGSTQ
ncbi:hypothetical protein Q8F55_003354 [Vanrija albida]|uniref:Uncharacterized protein n=1 Tax=Vanrija albida TaxID=181172 RepID=A0ABR3Q4K1_9TREE